MENLGTEITILIASNVVTGVLSSFITVARMKVHLEYLKESVTRAHMRIDKIPHT